MTHLRPFQVVDRGGARAIVRGGLLASTIATVPPYRPEAECAAIALVNEANRCRQVEGALRLLYAAAFAFQKRPSVKGWRDLAAAVGVARDALSEFA